MRRLASSETRTGESSRLSVDGVGQDVEAIYGKPSKCIITITIAHFALPLNENAC